MFKNSSSFKTSFIALSIFLFSGLLQQTFAQSIYLEWVDTPLESIVVNWIDDPGSGSIVEYRQIGDESWMSESGTDRSIPGTGSKIAHTVKLTGLSAGTGYEFRVDDDNEIYKFRTAPNSLTDPIKFIVAGDILDTGGNLEEAKQDFSDVSKVAASYNPYFIVVGGDLANAEGNLANVDQWFFFFETWHANLRTDDGFMIPLVAAIGNNEVVGSFGQSPSEAPFFYTFFRYPQDQWGNKVSYGKVDFNNYLSIVTLDSDHTHRIPGFQTDWLDNTLKNRRNFRHVIPVYHVAGWPNFRSFRGEQEDLVRNNWHPLFRNNGIRLVFEHHDHNFKKSFPIGNCDDEIIHSNSCQYGNDARNGVIYMGGGSWASDNNRTAEKRWYLDKVSQQIHNFVVVEIAEKYRTATAIGEDNQVLDTFTDYIRLDPPVALAPEVISENSFVARWEEVEGASIYKIDVATDPNFSTIWQNYDDISVGKNTEVVLNNLEPERVYYYRVRAQNELTISDYSKVITGQLIKVDPDESSLLVQEETVEADDQMTSTISATIIDEDGELVDNFNVSIFAEQGNLKVVENPVATNSEGVAEFQVFNDRAETVTYGVTAGNTEITQKVQVTYIPPAPVALTATDVENRQFTANWEVVNNADTYLLDVATDENFSNLVAGYNGLDVGNITSYVVTEVSPGTTYHYRIRAVTDDLIGANSQSIQTTTFPDSPVATEASNLSVISFQANWEAAEGARGYRLDVARDQNFEQFVTGYENLDVGNVQTYEVDGLLPGRDYFYRVRSESGPRVSGNSNRTEATTLTINTETSELIASQLRVLANGDQANEIMIVIRGENGELQEGVPVALTAESGSSDIEETQPVTNEEGIALFSVTNTQAETVTYSVTAATTDLGEISLEFIQDEGVLTLGNNFPNPFRFESSIPLSVPSSMHIKLEVFNSLGSPVRTLLNEELETGYYEVPFNGADLAAGVYFYRLITEEGNKTGKMVLVK